MVSLQIGASLRRLVRLFIPSLASAAIAKAIGTLIGGMAGNAAWDQFKEAVPVFKDANKPSFFIGLVVLILVLILVSGSDVPNEDTSSATTTWWRGYERRWMFGIGMLVLAACYYWGSSSDQASQEGEKPKVTASTETARPAPPSPPRTAPATAHRPEAAPSVPQDRSSHPPLFDHARLAKTGNAVALAVKGDPDIAAMVTDALGVTPDRKALTPAFFRQRYLERILAGEPDVFAAEAVPDALKRVLALNVSSTPARKHDVPADAIQVSARIHIVIIDAHSGKTLYKNSMTVDGMGFTEEFARIALKNNLEESLSRAKEMLSKPGT